MIWFYNHHFATWPINVVDRPNTIPALNKNDLMNPNHLIYPWYWIPALDVEASYIKRDSNNKILWEWKHSWTLGIRKVSNSTNERTCVVCFIPRFVGVGESIHFVNPSRSTMQGCIFMSMLNSLSFDYIVRQKMGGSNMSNYIIAQLPILTPKQIEDSGFQQEIIERVGKLVWFNHDMDCWMEELREECPAEYDLPEEPVIWDEGQRAVWQAELDAIFAHLYGFTTEDLRYILDPEDVCGKGCINETFRVLKERELRELGEYRTKRLVMEAWNKFGFNN